MTKEKIRESFYDSDYFYVADDAAEFILDNPGSHFDVAKARRIAEVHGFTEEDKRSIFAHIAALCCEDDVNALIAGSDINEYNDMLRSVNCPSYQLINTDVIKAKLLYDVYRECSIGVNYGSALGDFLGCKLRTSFKLEEKSAKAYALHHIPKRVLAARRLKIMTNRVVAALTIV